MAFSALKRQRLYNLNGRKIHERTSQKVLEVLLEKCADEGITNIESIEVLRVNPFDEFGSPIEIINEFGSKEKYLKAVRELEIELYKSA